MARFVSTLGMVLLAVVAWAGQGVNPHMHASTCFPKQPASCDYRICELCHTPAASPPTDYRTSWNPGGQSIAEAYPVAEGAREMFINVDGVEFLCAECHDMDMARHHSASDEYRVLLGRLVTVTEGPNLLDPKMADACKLNCTTCHDPHSREANLLRPNLEASVTCLTCHME